METAWIGDFWALTVADIDFLNPRLGDAPGVRERGVRLELCPAELSSEGSVYVSQSHRIGPAVCRIDLLESAPGAADRMHWHPVMVDGEPDERVFDPAIGTDPTSWLRARLGEVVGLLDRAGVPDPERYAGDADLFASRADEVVGRVETGLARAREPWPEVQHDERGLAPVR